MAIELMTFQGKNLTPKDHAIMRQNSQSDGVLYGCELTHLGSNQVRISSGSINIRGRQVNVSEETILCELSTSGTIDGRIYVKVDLADAVTPVELLTVAASTLPDLTQDDDFNTANGVWEMELGLYTASTTLISDLETTYKYVTTGDNGTVLWTNPSPTSSFASQTVTLSETIANYETYEIECFTKAGFSSVKTTGKIPIGVLAVLDTVLSTGSGFVGRFRSVSSLTGTSLTFSDASTQSFSASSATLDNTTMTPIRILGYHSK